MKVKMFDIYIKDNENVRYVLGTKGNRTLCVFGINPSTATDKKPDPTISRINTYLNRYGFDSFKMMNIYPLRATEPDSLPMQIDMNIHRRNMKEIEQALISYSAVLCACGNLIYERDYLKQCFMDISELINRSKVPTYCLGKTKLGNPRHPLARKPTPAELTKFDVENYLEVING